MGTISFKAYDILSSLIPGALVLLVMLNVLGLKYNKDLILAYTAVSFMLGYAINALGSWLEGFYFVTWGGKPSDNLLKGKSIWKVKFYDCEGVKNLLKEQTRNPNTSNDELFSIAKRTVTGIKDSRIEDFNALYAFSRSLLTAVLISSVILLFQHRTELKYYFLLLPLLFITWLRCKQRGYYYAREVLNEYLKREKAISKLS